MSANAPPENLPALLAAARGDAPADLLLANARIINVFSGEIEESNIAILGDRIAGLGTGYAGRRSVDLGGAYVAPGLIDAHVHIESSLCVPPHYASAVVPRGVTTVVADPHEIGNVAGADGIRFMARCARDLPLRVILMASSCVPATELATSGARLDADALTQLRHEGIVYGLAEVMNFPGVINGEGGVLAKLAAFADRPCDGHAPSVSGKALCAYCAAGIGSEHECVSVEEAREKLARGMYVLVREATNAHNLQALLRLITARNARRICFCTDDRQPSDLLTQGSVDYMIRQAIRFGIDPVEAFRMATLNPSEWFHLRDRGAVAPGRLADLMVFDDLAKPVARCVYSGGRLVAQDGQLAAGATFDPGSIPPSARSSQRVDVAKVNFQIPARGRKIRVIGSLADQLITDQRIFDARIDENRLAVADTDRDILKMAVIERHRGTGNVGLGFIQGFGLKRGAIAGTVAHDHHNLVVIGCDDTSMRAAAEAVAGGGLACAEGGQVVAALPLPVGGLMSDGEIGAVRGGYEALLSAARARGAAFHDPFMAMSFSALEVIPRLKLTDKGLVDVEAFRIVDLFV